MMILNFCSGMLALFLPLYFYKIFLVIQERTESKAVVAAPQAVTEMQVELAMA